jgi:hypothetical protein
VSTPEEQAQNEENFRQDLADPSFLPEVEQAIRDAGFPVIDSEGNPT